MKCLYTSILLAVLSVRSVSSADEFSPNAFADTYNGWTMKLKSHTVGNLDAGEIDSWIATKEQWKILQKYMDRYYRNQGYQP